MFLLAFILGLVGSAILEPPVLLSPTIQDQSQANLLVSQVISQQPHTKFLVQPQANLLVPQVVPEQHTKLLLAPQQPPANLLVTPQQPPVNLLVAPQQPPANVVVAPQQPPANLLVTPQQPPGNVLLVQPQQVCTVDEAIQSTFHAPARAVAFPQVDPLTKRQFLLLFHREGNPGHIHTDPHDRVTDAINCPSIIDQGIIDQINNLCPRDAFFYSLAARHLTATTMLQGQFMLQRTARDVLRLARQLLHRHSLNPRVWYYALVGTLLARSDLNGYYVAWALDATPDLYVPWTIIRQAIRNSGRPAPPTTVNQCRNAVGILVTNASAIETQRPLVLSNQAPAALQPPQQNRIRREAPLDFGFGGYSGNHQQEYRPPHDHGEIDRSRLVEYPTTVFTVKGYPNKQFTGEGYTSQGFNQKGYEPEYQPPKQYSPKGYAPKAYTPKYFVPKGYGPVKDPAPTENPACASLDPPMIPERNEPATIGECILFNGTGGATRPAENQLWYFREDVQVNQHHWYWHQYFPQTSMMHSNRRGETFYFAHHNIIARYNAERISNGLNREEPLDLRLNGNIQTGYNSDIIDRVSGRFWTPREDSVPLSDVSHETDPDFMIGVTMGRISNVHETLVSHIGRGFLVANRSLQAGRPATEFLLDIRNQPGLNDLGNTVEAGDETINTHPDIYHNYGVHNLAHVAAGLSMDPDFRCRMPTGVLADLTVTMRDPAFYKIHTFVDVLFDHHKSTLPPYQVSSGEWPLVWPGVQIQKLEMFHSQAVNLIKTFWQIKNFPLEEGIDGSIHEGDVDAHVCQQHLNHEPFQFKLIIDVDSCWQSTSNRGTVRLFMAPRNDATGRKFTMAEQRTLFFQLDAFPVDLRRGRNVITRNSADSSSTRPWTRSLKDMLRDPDNGGQTEYCGCGWPRHLYMPKGTPQGMEFDLFAMVTNYDQDQVTNTPENLRIPEPCNSPYLFCGVPYRQYPDARPMGYPFDRHSYSVLDGSVVRPVNSLEEYVANVPNMKSSTVIIQHVDAVLQ